MTDKIKYGVIGVGALGRHHARWVKSFSQCELYGVYDIQNDRNNEVAHEIGCHPCSSLDEIIDECDAVSIAVTTSDHAKVALKAIDADCHVLIEKPITSTLQEADEVISAAANKGVKLMVGHIERFNPALQVLNNYYIRPKFIEAHRLAEFNPRGSDVAVVLDLMIHDIDLALLLIKSPIRQISASAVAVVSDSEDIANARLTFENGAVANLTASRISLRAMRKLRIFQSSGYYSLDLAEKQADLYRLLTDAPRSGELTMPLGASGQRLGYFKGGDKSRDMLEAELQAFIDAVILDSPVPITGEEGRQALAVALEIICESQRTTQAFSSDE